MNVRSSGNEAWTQAFYQAYLINLMEHILSVVTDSSQAQVAGNQIYV